MIFFFFPQSRSTLNGKCIHVKTAYSTFVIFVYCPVIWCVICFSLEKMICASGCVNYMVKIHGYFPPEYFYPYSGTVSFSYPLAHFLYLLANNICDLLHNKGSQAYKMLSLSSSFSITFSYLSFSPSSPFIISVGLATVSLVPSGTGTAWPVWCWPLKSRLALRVAAAILTTLASSGMGQPYVIILRLVKTT